MEKIKPIKLKDIPYSKYKVLEDFVNETKDEDLLAVGMISLYYDISQEEVRRLTLEEVEVLIQHINVEVNNRKFNNIIAVDGKRYGFIPNFQKITAGELIDLDTLLKDGNWIGIMSILYRPLVKGIDKWGQYEIESYNEFNEELFTNVSAADVIGCRDFFTKSFYQLNPDFLISTT